MTKTIIYGTGVYGKRVFESLSLKKMLVEMFLVTKKGNIADEIEGIPVYELKEVKRDILYDAEIIVAVNEQYHLMIKKEIIAHLGNNGLEKVVFYSKEDIDKLFRETHPFDIGSFITCTAPVSRLFGNERGTPVDRYYIERYLEKESEQLSNCEYIIEVGEDVYSKRFFPDCQHDILDYSKGMDLTISETLPQNKYDVFICTQVFHQIFDISAAIKGSFQLLKSGGIMLATVCGNISKLARNEEYEHYWGFTDISIKKMVQSVFGEEAVKVESYGNAAVATAFVQGLSLEELNTEILDEVDKDFTICISITARKN